MFLCNIEINPNPLYPEATQELCTLDHLRDVRETKAERDKATD